jgi:UDP-N-acetylmuramoylalanine--D-glutamate ligase
MLGGRDKNTPLDELVEIAAKTCRAVVCYGEAGPRFLAAFGPAAEGKGLAVLQASDFRSAFFTAVKAAQEKDAVLLSPACASFDEFASFEQRGVAFKELVAALRQKRESGGEPAGAKDGMGRDR